MHFRPGFRNEVTGELREVYGIDGDLMVCGSCGQKSRVLWPDDREGIESVLSHRPIPESRNWLPGETVDDLKRENIEHGLVVA